MVLRESDGGEMNREKVYTQVRAAIRKGILVRGKQCEICNSKDFKCKDGRSYIHAHHEDYTKPLEVKWLCASCHKKTSLYDPETHPNSKLSRVKVKAIKELYTYNGWKKTDLASLFMVNITTIIRVVNDESWIKERSK